MFHVQSDLKCQAINLEPEVGSHSNRIGDLVSSSKFLDQKLRRRK